MRVLIGCGSVQPYISQLVGALNEVADSCTAHHGDLDSWEHREDIDVLHLQWPEALTGWDEPTAEELDRLRHALAVWRRQATIVTTVHNYHPHQGPSEAFERLYRLVYAASSGIVHMGEASRMFFQEAYPTLSSEQAHATIPHGDYSYFQNSMSRPEARRKLGLDPDDRVVLSFGHHRHMHELKRAVDGFRRVPTGAVCHSRLHLLIAGENSLPHGRVQRFKRLLHAWYWKILFSPRIGLHEGWVPDENVQTFLNAADVLLIPRKGVLNSGNVALGFTFGRPVVGPDEGVIGEVLRATGNPVFNPEDPESVATAIDEALEKEDLSERNRVYAREHFNWESVAQQHLSFYEEVQKHTKAN